MRGQYEPVDRGHRSQEDDLVVCQIKRHLSATRSCSKKTTAQLAARAMRYSRHSHGRSGQDPRPAPRRATSGPSNCPANCLTTTRTRAVRGKSGRSGPRPYTEHKKLVTLPANWTTRSSSATIGMESEDELPRTGFATTSRPRSHEEVRPSIKRDQVRSQYLLRQSRFRTCRADLSQPPGRAGRGPASCVEHGQPWASPEAEIAKRVDAIRTGAVEGCQPRTSRLYFVFEKIAEDWDVSRPPRTN